MGAVERDVSSPEVIEGVDGGWDVSSQKVLGCEGGHGDGTSPPREGGFDRGWHDRKQRESMAARRVVSGPSDFARPVRRLAHPRNPRNPRSVLWPVTRRASLLGSARRTSAFSFVAGSAGPQTTQKDAELGRALARTEYVRPGEAPSMSFLSPPWYRGASRCIGTHGWRRLRGATTPSPLRKRRGLDVLGTGDRGWRPGGLTPGYCLKPFQGFEDGLGKGRGSPELMTGIASTWEAGDETSPTPKQLASGWGLGRLVPRGVGFEGVGGVETRRLHPRSN